MNKNYTLYKWTRLRTAMLLVWLTMLGAWNRADAQVTVTGSTGADGSYTTLKGAFDALNLQATQGGNNIVIDITGNTTETATAVLNQPTTSSWTTLIIRPSGGATRTISGAIAAGSPLIDLNGADNVTIDGLNTGGNALTISNTTVSATSGTSTIRFQTDATSNTITNCSILGSATMAPGTNGGNIWFGSAAVTTGNDNNTISNCDIGPAGLNLPTKGIYFSGSSNTHPGTANSGITINNNNIFDYFSATASSAGIDLNSGSTNLTISNNRFYQTATRTMTSTGLTHSGIRINNTSGNAYIITNNTIGFANSGGSGAYTMVFPTTTTAAVIGINLSVGTTTTTSVQGNTIAGIALSGGASGTSSAAPFRGIYVGSGLTTVGDIAGNTIGSMASNGSITYTSSSTSASDVIGIFNFGSSNYTLSNNNVGGITVGNSSTGAANLYGLRVNTGSGVTFTCQNNTIGGTVANSLQSTSTATGTTVQGILNSNPIGTITNNIIRNLTAAGGTGTTTTASVIGICMNAGSANQTLSQNTIHTLTNTNTTAATIVTGIQFTGSTANIVERNFIYGLTSATNSASAEINGIRVSGGTTTYRNNMIALGVGVSNAIGSAASNSGTTGIVGINEFLGTNQFWHNSVYIGGTATAGTGASYAFNGTQTTNTRSFRNNIFFNARTNGGATGKHYAVKINGTTANPTGLTINNNVYFVNGTGGVFGFFNSLDVANIVAWRIAVGQDANSIESNPQYNDPTNTIPDLHIHPTNATGIEGNGIDLGVTNDYDGQTRAGLTPVDIGADAGNFTGLDLFAPTITYTLLGNTSSTANRSLTNVVVTDLSGVNGISGTRPRIYYKRSTDANTFLDNTNATNGWKYVEASGSASPFTFTIDYSLLNGTVTSGTVIQYFVVAQDLAATPNVGINSGVFAVAPTSVDLTSTAFPLGGTINQYTIAITYSGTINVGTSETITSLTNAGGLFERLNAGVLVGNLTVNVTSDLTTETGLVALNALTEEPAASNFSIIIVPSGGAMRNISGSINSSALIKLNGVSRITIDGLNTGGNGFTISNNATTGPSVVNVGSVGTTPISNVTITNTTIINGVNTSSAIVVGDATTIGNAGYFTNVTISNNNIQRAFIGIFINAVVSAGNGNNTTVNGNLLNTSGANAIRNTGIYLQGVGSGTVNNNTIANFEAATSETDRGIWLATGTSNVNVTNNTISNMVLTATASSPIGINITTGVANSNVVVSQNNISGITSSGTVASMGIQVTGAIGGVTISKNTITNIKNTNTGGWGASGIRLNSTLTTANIQVDNNSISDVATVGFNGSTFEDNGYGIIIDAGGGYRVYYNSINMNANQTAATGLPAAFNVTSVVTTAASVDVRNNIFVNNQTAGNTERYAIFSGAANTVYSNINYNNYFTATGANLGFLGSARANLAAWQTATTQDANSVSIDPTFTSATNLLPTNPLLDARGTPIAGITTDITGATRNATTPDVGAYEFNGCPTITLSPVAGALTAGTIGSAYSVTISQTGLSGTPAWSISAGTLPGGLSINGTSGAITGTPTATGTFNFTVQVTDGTCSQTQAYSIVVSCPTITFVNTTASNATIGTAYSLDASVTGNTQAITYSVSPALPAGLSLNTSTGAITGTPTAIAASATYTVTASQSSGACTVTQNYTFAVVCPTIAITPVAGALTAGTIGSAYSVTISQTGLSGTPVWSISAGTLPGGLSINGTSGAITGTPTATGTFNFTVQVTDGTCTQTQAYSIVVSCPALSFINTVAPNGTVGSAYNFDASVTGNTQAITYSVSPALPAGLSLNTSTGAITGTPTAQTAATAYTITASQSGGICTATQIYTFSVNCAGITITPAAGTLTAGTIGSAYSVSISQTGLAGTPAWSISAGTLPGGLSINGTSGEVSGTPTATGTFNFTVQVTDGTCTASQAYSIVVSCPTIVFVNASASNATIGTAYNLDASVTGNTATVTYSVSPALPAGLTLNTSTGAITGTPTATTASATYTVTASQSGGACTATQNYTFGVVCPTITFVNTTASNATIGTAYSLDASVTGNTATITYSISPALPAGLSLNTSTGAITGTPTAQAASATYTVTASQSGGVCTATQNYTFAVNCAGVSISPNTLPNGVLSTAYSQTLTQTGLSGTPAWSVSTGALPTGLSLNGTSGVISGTPSALGTFNFTVQVTDGTCSTSQAYTVVISCTGVSVNPATLPNATQLAAYSQTLTQTGLSGTVTWSVSAGTLPTGLTLNTISGVISGTPSTLGTFNFTIQATDGTCSATRAYTVLVAASGPIIEISVTDIDFGDVLILQSSRKTITVRNIGVAPLSLSSMSMPNVVFNYGFIGTVSILPNESREFEVSFTPIAVASYSGTVTVNSNAVGGVNTFTVRGNGINPTALNTGKDVVLKAYPNPTADKVNISVENAWIGEYNVSVKDLLGKEVMSQKSNTSASQVDLNNLPSGLYLIQVSHKNGTKTIQIAKK